MILSFYDSMNAVLLDHLQIKAGQTVPTTDMVTKKAVTTPYLWTTVNVFMAKKLQFTVEKTSLWWLLPMSVLSNWSEHH